MMFGFPFIGNGTIHTIKNFSGVWHAIFTPPRKVRFVFMEVIEANLILPLLYDVFNLLDKPNFLHYWVKTATDN